MGQGALGGGVWEQEEELGFPGPGGFTTLSSGLDGTAASYTCRGRPRQVASPLGCQIPGKFQEPAAPSAPWWVPGQRRSSKEELAREEREQGGEECWFMTVW